MEKTVKEIAKEIKTELHKIEGVKISARSGRATYTPTLDVSIQQAPFPLTTNGWDYMQVNHFYFMEDARLTKEAKTLFGMIKEIIDKYHWDESDPMTDYFHTAFYMHFAIGQYEKPAVITA